MSSEKSSVVSFMYLQRFSIMWCVCSCVCAVFEVDFLDVAHVFSLVKMHVFN